MEKIVIRCKSCNQRLCDYTLQGEDNVHVLQGISIKYRCEALETQGNEPD